MQKFLTGAMILAGAGILCRIIGVVIRIPLANIVGNYGIGIYQMVFPLYALLLVISSAGVPVAISKMVAKNETPPQKILFNSVILLGFIGAIMSALFMIFSFQIASFQGDRAVGIVYLAIAPSVFLVCVISAFRGYFQGRQNMIPTATSQIIEQIVKLIFAISLALIFVKISILYAVFGAILAVTISESVALLFLITVFVFSNKKKGQTGGNDAFSKKVDFKLMFDILKQSIPITLMSAIFPLVLVVDSLFVINMLSGAGISHEEATKLFGIQSGVVHVLINLPAVLGVAIATAIVPQVSALIKQNRVEELRKKMSLAVKITVIIALFFTLFYLFFAPQIIDLLYHRAFVGHQNHAILASGLLRVESALIVLMGLSMAFTAMLQGADRSKFPLIALGIGGAVKLVFQFIFIRTSMGIFALSIGNVICFSIACSVNVIYALRYIKIKRGFVKHSLSYAGLCGVFALVLRGLQIVMPSSFGWVVLDGVIALILYAILVVLFRFFGYNCKHEEQRVQ